MTLSIIVFTPDIRFAKIGEREREREKDEQTTKAGEPREREREREIGPPWFKWFEIGAKLKAQVWDEFAHTGKFNVSRYRQPFSIGYRIVPRYSSFLINGAEQEREERERGGGLYRNTDQHPDPPLLFSTFSFLFFFLPFRKRNPSRYPIKHGLSFVVVEISKITVGDQLSFDSRSMLNRPLSSSNLFSSQTTCSSQLQFGWREEKEKKPVSLLSRYKSRNFARSIDQIARGTIKRNVEKCHKLSRERD